MIFRPLKNRYWPAVFSSSALGLLLVAPTAMAGQLSFSNKLIAPDGVYGDHFGYSVAIDGTRALVGARDDDDNGSQSGSAYLFDTTTGSLLQKLTAPDGSYLDWFGSSVAIDGNRALVGAFGDDDRGDRSGSAYLFDTTNGSLLQKLTAPDGASGDFFGLSVAIDGNRALVGAFGDDDRGDRSGSAYLFDTTTGSLLQKLTAPDGASGDFFGDSVAIGGNLALVGAWLDDDRGDSSGSAYLFDTTTGSLLQKLTAPDGAYGDLFGLSVAIDGNLALVAAYRDDDKGSGSGSAYLFDTTTGSLLHKLTAPDGAANDYFGYSVAIDGTRALIGAHGDDDNGRSSGSAYLFDTTTGFFLQKLTAPDGANYDYFGWSVAIDGTRALVGAWLDDDNGSSSGSAYLFESESVPEPSFVFGLAVLGALATAGKLKNKAGSIKTQFLGLGRK